MSPRTTAGLALGFASAMVSSLALAPCAEAMQVQGLEEERLVAGPAPAFVMESQRLTTTSAGGVATTSSARRERWRTDAYRIAIDSPNAADPGHGRGAGYRSNCCATPLRETRGV